MAKSMTCRPSALLGISDPLTAFYTDRACWTFATMVENEMDEAESRLPSSAKDKTHRRARQRVLDSYLGIDETAVASERFRAPTGR